MSITTTDLTRGAARLLVLIEERGEAGASYREVLERVGAKSSLSRATHELEEARLLHREEGHYYLAGTRDEPETVTAERIRAALRDPGPELWAALQGWGAGNNYGPPVIRAAVVQAGGDRGRWRDYQHLVYPRLVMGDSLGLWNLYKRRQG